MIYSNTNQLITEDFILVIYLFDKYIKTNSFLKTNKATVYFYIHTIKE